MNEKLLLLEIHVSIASCGIGNFESIVSERVHVNPDNSRAMSELTFLLFKLNQIEYTAQH